MLFLSWGWGRRKGGCFKFLSPSPAQEIRFRLLCLRTRGSCPAWGGEGKTAEETHVGLRGISDY